jgi:hypothetical protein
LVLRFTKDGSVSLDSVGTLYARRLVATYTVAGDQITVDVDHGPAGCAVGQHLVMRASQPEAGLLHVVHTAPVTGNCLADQDERWVLEQVLPPKNRGLAGLASSGDHFRPVGDPLALYGDWMAQGGGHVLELTGPGASPNGGFYYVAAASGDVVDLGHWTLDASHSQLRLASGWEGNAGTCEFGDRLVLGDLALADSHPSAAFRGKVKQNTCGAAWTPKAWLLLPHQGS